MVLLKEWINLKGEEFMPEARSCVQLDAVTIDQPERGGIDG
jgi:hypothetical protein